MYISPNGFIFAEFRDGRAPILVATDVASRGLGLFLILLVLLTMIDKSLQPSLVLSTKSWTWTLFLC